MRNKQVIEQLCQKARSTTEFLHKDISANKPHMTVDYIEQQLGYIISYLETQQQYLDLED